jgi:hypothetical protein
MNNVKTRSCPKKIKKPFTQEEDKLIEEYIQEYGMQNLKELEKTLRNRSTRQIRERYRLYLGSNVNHSPFSAQEDELLLTSFVQFHVKWSFIAKIFSGRLMLLSSTAIAS